ncbi:MAG: Gfo/Idh/MocA family oxidoreductase [Syntrophobacteria bacterium]|jgi:predicted dehydrogenase|nr:Gfo/Idh/MocA family oxidoreductase [Deltaproteobacteria bacterium]MDH3851076.1 Gfo/Idh/MocA family oxidoreductase [Deltaproteobacteria bacterium]MDH3927587.1 Gfo/Idh/MocA family oxidoreductase [Deltaproteobacteria bacterium]MDH3951006.1 Gfo/Idh/MocA family oxidoreductase [Deltaproteobacteria bacterium]
MIIHPTTSVLFVVGDDDSSLQPLLSYLQNIGHLKLTIESQMVKDLSPYDVVVTENTAAFAGDNEQLTKFVHRGGGWLGLVKLSDKPLPQLFGAQTNPLGPEAELRVLFKNKDHPLATRLPEAIYLKGCHQPLDKTTEDTETVLYADWHYQHSPVLVRRTASEGQVACTTLHAYNDPAFQQILYRLLRLLAGHFEPHRTYGVGLLGYAQSVGQPHGLGIEATPGLILRAACDLDKERLRQAQQDFPEVKTYDSAEGLAKDPEVDVVIVATPPNTHADLSLKMMAAGKHVVCEKPLALNSKETAAMVEMAGKQHVLLSCHQNRRWDVDYLAIKQALTDGLIGDLFYLETFVGGFNHPCGYWHSHDAISGGTTYDWGAHYLDWVVSLIPERVTAVISTRQNRVWHDVTNADQERIQIRFAGGLEAEFIHSDIAAVRKPKWYVLGTKGAIVGHWRDVTSYEIDPIVYFHEHDIPATEMVPDLTLHHRHHSGQIVAQKLALPEREHYLFHRNLADHLLTGEPIVAPLEDSVRVVGILEAAARSAAKGGTVEVLND